MKLKLIHPKKLLATSGDQGLICNRNYIIDDFSFTVGSLDSFDCIENDVLKSNIINNLTNPKPSFIGDYLSEEGLELFALLRQNKILIVSFGEANRNIYKIYLEGIWETDDIS